MSRHFEQRNVPYAPEQMFALIAGIEHYPEFLPWCLESRVKKRKNGTLEADLVVGYKTFRETFSSVVTLEEQRIIRADYQAGPLSHLTNEWRFSPAPKGGCDMTFFVDFGFRSPLLGSMINLFFDKAFRKMAAAFETRAAALYGKQSWAIGDRQPSCR